MFSLLVHWEFVALHRDGGGGGSAEGMKGGGDSTFWLTCFA